MHPSIQNGRHVYNNATLQQREKAAKQYINSNSMCWSADIERMVRLPVLLQSLQINMPRVVPQHNHTTSYQYVCIGISTNG